MNTRERFLALGVLTIIAVAAGAFLFHQLFLSPLQDDNASIARLRQDIDKQQDRLRQAQAEKARLERWRLLSLPADVDMARREYENYLSDLLRKSGFAPASFTVTPRPADSKSSPTIAGKGPVYTRLSFAVQGHGSLAAIVDMMERFYRTPLLHEIKNLQIQRPVTTANQQTAGELDLALTAEALIMAGADNRPYLLPNIDRRLFVLDAVTALRGGPPGLALASWAAGPTGPRGPGVLAPGRRYAAIAAKNIFLGPTVVPERPPNEVEVTQFVHLTDVSRNNQRSEAFLYDRYNNRNTRLRAEPGFDAFKVLDNEGETLVRGKVIRIEARDLVFRVDNSYYSIHVGQSLEDAMRRPLNTEELKKLGVAAADEVSSVENR